MLYSNLRKHLPQSRVNNYIIQVIKKQGGVIDDKLTHAILAVYRIMHVISY